MLGLSPSVSIVVCSLLSAFILYLFVCGLRIKLETWQCIYREQPSPLCTTHPPQLALLAQLFYLREGCCCCHLAKASHCKLATKWLRQMGYVIKCGYSNCMYASLHVVSLCVCSVYVCGSVGVWLFECVSLFSIASQPEWELGQGISRSFSCYCCCHWCSCCCWCCCCCCCYCCYACRCWFLLCTYARYQPFYAALIPTPR